MSVNITILYTTFNVIFNYVYAKTNVSVYFIVSLTRKWLKCIQIMFICIPTWTFLSSDCSFYFNMYSDNVHEKTKFSVFNCSFETFLSSDCSFYSSQNIFQHGHFCLQIVHL